MQYFANIAQLYMAASPEKAAAFSWRDMLSVFGIVLPILVGVIFYLLKRKADTENESRRQEVKDLKDRIKGLDDELTDLRKELQKATSDILSHQNSCSRRYVDQTKYDSDATVQKGQIETMNKMLDTTTDMLESTQRLVEQILRSS
jgi:peptidoglycan hydrolase CwlO-like protein